MKKGFTLVELLAVIVLLGGILMVAMALITGQIRNQEEDINEAELKTYCAAAKLYANKTDYSARLTEIKLKTLEQHNILTNLDDKYKEKSIYVQYVGNYYCCCADKDAKTCNQSICKDSVTKG